MHNFIRTSLKNMQTAVFVAGANCGPELFGFHPQSKHASIKPHTPDNLQIQTCWKHPVAQQHPQQRCCTMPGSSTTSASSSTSFPLANCMNASQDTNSPLFRVILSTMSLTPLISASFSKVSKWPSL